MSVVTERESGLLVVDRGQEIKRGPVVAIVGGQWGDEGKGKLINDLARDAYLVIRSNGGDNAGHTIENEFGTYVHHIVPSGMSYPNTINIIGPGAILNPISA